MFEAILNGYRYFFLMLADLFGIGWGIVALSVITSALMAPLIKVVSGIVRRETEYQSVLLPQIAEIKRNYPTDMERTLHIQRLYARYGYSPLSAVKKVLPLFVQIPFLLLTYYMLKGTPQLNGVSFGLLKDLGAPDALVRSIGMLPVAFNVLPLAMTCVNLLTVVSTPGFTVKDQLNAASISLLFLVLLYTAPSALLLYWTLNNVITCLKTLLSSRAAGLKLLLKRIASVRELPRIIRLAATPVALAYAGLALLIIALYMRLMVGMLGRCLNYMVSYWLMCIVLTLLIWISYYSLCGPAHGKRIAWKVLLGFSAMTSLFLVVMMGGFVFRVKSIVLAFNRLDLGRFFDVLFVPWLVLLLWEYRKDWFNVMRDIKATFFQNSVWLALPALIAVHYSFSSANFKLPFASVVVLYLYMLLPVIVLAAFSIYIFRNRIPADNIYKMVVGACVGGYLVPMISREAGSFTGYGRNILLRFGLIFAVAFLLPLFKKRKTAVLFVSLLAVTILAIAVWNKHVPNGKNKTDAGNVVAEAKKVFPKLQCVRKNNVYLLVYDAYAHDIVLEALNIPHADLSSSLQSRGFSRYEAYATGSDTLTSMSSAFSTGGIVQGSPRSQVAGNNVFADTLKRSGYRTSYVLCSYEMPGSDERMPGDSYFPSPQKMTKPELVLYPCILRGLLSQAANTFNSYTEEEWIAWKRKEIAKMAGSEGNFIYAHSQRPGHCVANPMYRKSDSEELAIYAKRISMADAEMKADLDLIFSKDKDPLIIIASDHGAYLTVPKGKAGTYTAADLLDRCGIQLFVRWPKGYTPAMQINTLPNVFLETLICLTGDVSLKKYKSSGETHPFFYPLNAPAGAIRNATIQIGPQKNQNLFEAARHSFRKAAAH